MVVSIVDTGKEGRRYLPFDLKIDQEAIVKVFREWKFTEPEIEKLYLTFDFRNMVPEAAMSQGSLGGYCFAVYLRTGLVQSQNQELINKCVVHELRHIYYSVKVRPSSFKPVRWEEHNCRRMEEKYKNVNFLVLR